MEIIPEQVDLAEVLDEAIKVATPFQKVHVVKQYEQITVYIDKALILECLINIIHNAVDAMHGEGTITISVEPHGRRVLVSLMDTGSGMSKQQLTQVFEPFYSTKGRTGKNMGLGMYYVYKVMEAHKGKVMLQSEPGKGTTVTLQFKQRRESNGKDKRFTG